MVFKSQYRTARHRMARGSWLLGLIGALLACSPEPGVVLEQETITVACGRCILEMEGVEGCPWAAEIDGKAYLIRGAVPHDHNSHEADGICNMKRKAIVDGEIRGELLVVSAMSLIPAEAIPENPRFAPDEKH